MNSASLKAVVLANEISLNKIAEHFGIQKKFKWEDQLFLNQDSLKGILKEPEIKLVYIYHFGSIVFINLTHHEIMDVINYLKTVEKSLNNSTTFTFVDDYRIDLGTEDSFSISNDFMIVPEVKDYYLEIVATVLAKSVALEKIEAGLEILSDEIEDIMEFLEKGHLNLSEEKLAKIWSRILGFKYNTISYIMLLDKPDITWTNHEAEKLFSQLSKLFELEDRYRNIRHKTETLADITEAFGSLTHTKRSNRLEWMIILLFLFEILFSLGEKLFHALR